MTIQGDQSKPRLWAVSNFKSTANTGQPAVLERMRGNSQLPCLSLSLVLIGLMSLLPSTLSRAEPTLFKNDRKIGSKDDNSVYFFVAAA